VRSRASGAYSSGDHVLVLVLVLVLVIGSGLLDVLTVILIVVVCVAQYAPPIRLAPCPVIY
jgi:hypothetical protein